MRIMTSRPRLTYANVMSTIGVFLALAGTSWAAFKVTGRNVVDGSLTGADIRNSSLTTLDIKNRSIAASDIGSGSITSNELADSAVTSAKITDGTITASDLQTGLTAAVRASTVVTRTTVSSLDDAATAPLNWQLLGTLGTFIKQDASTRIMVQAQGTTLVNDPLTKTCSFQIRIDGKTAAGSSTTDGTLVEDSATIEGTNAAAATPVTIFADYPGLAAGLHTLTIWDRGTATACRWDPTLTGSRALVTEVSSL